MRIILKTPESIISRNIIDSMCTDRSRATVMKVIAKLHGGITDTSEVIDGNIRVTEKIYKLLPPQEQMNINNVNGLASNYIHTFLV